MPPPPVSSTQLQQSSSSAAIYQTNTQIQQQFYHSNQTSFKLAKEPTVADTSPASFWDNYEHICALQNLIPVQAIKASLACEGASVLNLNADKLRSADWEPIFAAIRINKGLSKIVISSNYNPQGDNDETSRLVKGFSKLKKPPSIRNKDRIKELCRSLKDCLAISHSINHLELYNIPLTIKDLAHVAKGLRSNKSLKMLSLERCSIGDEGLATICKDIQSSNNLNRINFSSCELTHEGAEILANLIKVQALKRHNEAWKDSLRYGRPDLDSMFGIRRITINSNPKIGDRGVFLLAEAFKSDLWLKALDLQDCGITTTGANYLLEGLKFNAMMHVLDVRLNVKIDRDTLQKIMEQVMINSSGHSTDYEWMDLTQAAAISMNISTKPTKEMKPTSPSKHEPTTTQQLQQQQQQQQQLQVTKREMKKRRVTNTSFSKRNQFMASGSSSVGKMKRCKSTGSVIFNKSVISNGSGGHTDNNRQTSHYHNHYKESQTSGGGGGGVPWRTAARANRYRVSTSCADEYEEAEADGCDEYDVVVDKENLWDDVESGGVEFVSDERVRAHRVSGKNHGKEIIMTNSTFDNEKLNHMNRVHQAGINNQKQRGSKPSICETAKSEFASNLDKIKNMSVKDLLVILQREQESKTQLEDMLLRLQDDNTRLKSQISVLKSKLDQQQHEIQKSKNRNNSTSSNNNMNSTLLNDDKALEIIELTLYKYQGFLDFLRNAGFGKLIEMGDLNQEQVMNSNKQQQRKVGKNVVVAKSGSSSSSGGKMNEEQKYYLEKINKTRSKMNGRSQGSLESTKNYSVNEGDGVSGVGIGGYDIIDKSLINGQDSAENHHIDTLLSNALEISRSYRRLNSSSANNSLLSHYHQNLHSRNQRVHPNDTNLLSEIEETNRESYQNNENSTTTTTSSSATNTGKSMKKASVSSSTLINEASFVARPKSSRGINNNINKLAIDTVLEKLSIHDQSADGSQSQSKTRGTGSSVSPANTIVPKVAVRQFKKLRGGGGGSGGVGDEEDEGEVHEEDVSEILSDFEGEEEDNVYKSEKNGYGGFQIDEVFDDDNDDDAADDDDEDDNDDSNDDDDQSRDKS